jgi:hypothetical protein
MKKVDILSFDGCPHTDDTVERVRHVARKLGVDIELHLVGVHNGEEAVRLRFLGSPTVRVDGVDIDPAAKQRTDFAMACRTYGGQGVPPDPLIAAALR